MAAVGDVCLPFVRRGDRYEGKCEMLRRIPRDVWEKLLGKVSAFSERDLEGGVLEAFQKGDWEHPIFSDTRWPFLALYAYLEDRISEDVFVHLNLYRICWEAHAEHHQSIQRWQLIDAAGNIDPEALQAFRIAAKVDLLARAVVGKPGYYLNDTSLFTEEQLQEFVAAMKRGDPQESQFFQVQHPGDGLIRTLKGLGVWPLLRCVKNVFEQTILHPQMLRTVLRVRFGEQARMPLFVVGYFQIEKMSDPTRRVVSIFWPSEFPTPPLHVRMTTPLSAIQHDAMYHLLVDSANPYRQQAIDLGLFFKGKKFLNVAEMLLDQNFPGSVYLLVKDHGVLCGGPGDPSPWKATMTHVSFALREGRKTDLFWFLLWEVSRGLRRIHCDFDLDKNPISPVPAMCAQCFQEHRVEWAKLGLTLDSALEYFDWLQHQPESNERAPLIAKALYDAFIPGVIQKSEYAKEAP